MRQVIAFLLAAGVSFFLFVLMSALINKEVKATPGKNLEVIEWSIDTPEVAPDITVRQTKKKLEMKPLVKPPTVPKVAVEKKAERPTIATKNFDSSTQIKLALSEGASRKIALASGLGKHPQSESSDVMPKIRIEPRYPREPALKGIEGFVTLSFDINTLGEPTNIQIIEANPKGYFEKSAKKALRKWKYSPKKEDGRLVEVKSHRVTLNFQLEKG